MSAKWKEVSEQIIFDSVWVWGDLRLKLINSNKKLHNIFFDIENCFKVQGRIFSNDQKSIAFLLSVLDHLEAEMENGK